MRDGRTIAAAVAVACALATQAAAQVPHGAALGSTTEQVDVARTGFFGDYDLVPPLVVRWSVPAEPQAPVLAADGRVYLAGGSVVALDQRDGRTLWEVGLGYPARGAAYDAGRLFVTAADRVLAFDAATGQLLWQHDLEGDQHADGVVAAGGVAYVTHAGAYLIALRAGDGSRLWSRETFGRPHVTLDDERVYVAGEDCRGVHAFARGDGSTAWVHETSCPGGGRLSAAALHGGFLYVPRDGPSAPGSPVPGSPVLEARSGAAVGSFRGGRPAFVGGLGVFRGADSTRAVELASGRERWRAEPFTDLVAVGHDVFTLTVAGGISVTARDARSGTELWREYAPWSAGSDERSQLAVAPGLLIVDAGHRITAYEPALRPPPGGVALAPRSLDVRATQRATAVGVVASDLRAARPQVTIERAPWRRGRFRPVGSVRSRRDGGFALRLGSRRNARFRVAVGGARSEPLVLYVRPDVGNTRAREIGGGRLLMEPTVYAPGVDLAGLRIVLYLQRADKPLRRLASARLVRAARVGRLQTTLRFRASTALRPDAGFVLCIRGALARGLGRPDAIGRRCGAARLPAP